MRGAAAAVLLLAACSEAEDPRAAEADRIECATGGGALRRVCTVERLASEEGLVLTLRAPDGSFRRLLVTRDGRGVVAADGAEEAAVTPLSEREIEVEIAGDVFRLPATVKPQ